MNQAATENNPPLIVPFGTFLAYSQNRANIEFYSPIPSNQKLINSWDLMTEQLRMLAGQWLGGFFTKLELGRALAGYTVATGTPNQYDGFRTMIKNMAKLIKQTSPLKATQTEIPLKAVDYRHNNVIIKVLPTFIIRKKSRESGIRCGAAFINMERPAINQKAMEIAIPLLDYFATNYYNKIPSETTATDLCYCYDIFTGRNVKGSIHDKPDFSKINKLCERIYQDWGQSKM